jgi:hypothetical protein
MGIGPFRGDGRRAPRGAIALGAVAAAVVLGAGAPLAYAMGRGPDNGMVRGRAAVGTGGHTVSPPHSTAAGQTGGSGSAQQTSSATLDSTVVGIAASTSGGGYWEVASDGGLFAAGDAAFHGSEGSKPLAGRVVGVAADPATGGYWEVASDGGIFSFGDARFYGSMGGHRLAAPIVGMAVTRNGKGYWEVASDGGIFSFGDAGFSGSMGGHKLGAPIVGMAANPAGAGYWEVARDGGVFSFAAPYDGSMGGKHLGSPVVGLAATPEAKGYWEVAGDGAVYAFGGAPYAGAAKVAAPAVAPAPAPAAASSPALENPSANVSPDPAYTFEAGQSYGASTSLPCWQLGASAWVPDASTPQCEAAEIAATNDARAGEGVGAMRLPSNFFSLTPEEQLFVVTDIERVGRGEPPVAGLSTVVNGYAQSGAASNSDPRFNFAAIPSSNWWGSNVVSGALNALDANYTWMYEDGYGGYNVDCTSPGAAGCWGHRANVLTSTHGGTLVMGAGDVGQRTGLQVLSELFVAVSNPGDLPPLYYTWADAVAAGAGG